MADHGGNQNHQPNSRGGFVSLDQARDIALGHARDNQDFYGRRYRKRGLAWAVVSQDERADAYYVRLSYQQARGFQGEPGVEEYVIGKSGAVQSRRILSEPRKRGGIPGCGLVAMGSLTVALLALAGLLGTVL